MKNFNFQSFMIGAIFGAFTLGVSQLVVKYYLIPYVTLP